MRNKKSLVFDGETSHLGGYFCQTDKVLAVACKLPFYKWFPTFVHESCHMDQYLENSKYWTIMNLPGGHCAGFQFTEWLEGRREMSSDRAYRYAQKILKCELDCEIRSAYKIKENNLSINLNHYIKSANAYILFYNFLAKYRKWTLPNRPVYKYNYIIDRMSPDFNMDYTKLPRWYERAVVEYCFDNKIKPFKWEK